MNEEITEVLEYEPGELFVKRYVRIKYAKLNNEGVLIGKLPTRPLEKAMAGPGLLAQIVIDKYVDHLPLHRQMQRLERGGVKIPYSTLTDWVSSTCKLIEPLYEALRKELLQCLYLHVDESLSRCCLPDCVIQAGIRTKRDKPTEGIIGFIRIAKYRKRYQHKSTHC
jgi:transposase